MLSFESFLEQQLLAHSEFVEQYSHSFFVPADWDDDDFGFLLELFFVADGVVLMLEKSYDVVTVGVVEASLAVVEDLEVEVELPPLHFSTCAGLPYL